MTRDLKERTAGLAKPLDLTGRAELSAAPVVAAAEPPAETGETDEELLHSEIAGAVLSVVRQFAGIKARLVDSAEGEMHLSILLAKVSLHGPLRASDLADRISADPSTISRQVAALVKAGLLERRADPEDGRASLLVVTAAGHARLAEHVARRGRATAPVLAGWSLRDRTELLRLVSRYAAGLQEHRDEIVSLLAGAGGPAGPAAQVGTGAPGPRPAPADSAGPDSVEPGSADPHSADPHSADPHSVHSHGAHPHRVEPDSADPHSAHSHSADPHGADPHGAHPRSSHSSSAAPTRPTGTEEDR